MRVDPISEPSPRRRKPGYEAIVLSPGETWTSTQFIDFFLQAQGYAVMRRIENWCA